MIRSFRPRGLKRLYEGDDARKLPADKLERIRQVLAQVDVAKTVTIGLSQPFAFTR